MSASFNSTGFLVVPGRTRRNYSLVPRIQTIIQAARYPDTNTWLRFSFVFYSIQAAQEKKKNTIAYSLLLRLLLLVLDN